MSENGRPVTLVHIVNAPQTLSSFLGRQAGYMKARGFEVIVISDPAEHLYRYGEAESVEVRGVKISRRISPLRDIISVWQLWRRLRSIRPHIVHAHTPKAGLIAMIASFLAGVPVRIYHIRGLPLVTAGRLQWLLRATEKITCRLAHRVLCVSPSIRDVVVAGHLCSEEKAASILHGSGNGIDATERFNPDRFTDEIRQAVRDGYDIPRHARVLGYVGRVIREKGIIELAEAWMVLRKRFPDLHLMIVGPFEPQDPIPDHVRNLLKNDPRVRIIGPNWDTPPLYAVMDVLAFPSYREGFGMVAIEAAAMRVPVVATRIPGCIDSVANGVTGTLVPPGDAQSLGEALAAYLQNPLLRERHGAAGRARALRDFRPERLSEATFAEYIRLLQSKQLPAPFQEESSFGKRAA